MGCDYMGCDYISLQVKEFAIFPNEVFYQIIIKTVILKDDRIKVLTLISMCLGLFTDQIDTTVVNLALPRIQSSIQATVSDLQWILDVYNLAFANLLLTGSTLGDLFGRKLVFITGLSLFIVGSLLCCVAPNLGALLSSLTIVGLL